MSHEPTDRDARSTDAVAVAQTSRPQEIDLFRDLLEREGIAYRTGLLAGPAPRLVFLVARSEAARARAALGGGRGTRPGQEVPFAGARPNGFPWGPAQAALALVLFHLALVFWIHGPWVDASRWLRGLGLVPGLVAEQPWRLLTSLLLHSGPSHAAWNGVSMIVFAVPLLVDYGYRSTLLTYALAGIGGGMTALAFTEPGTVVIGSSGAVAGLFGAWITLKLHESGRAALPRRARVRTLGIALLFLPTLLNPITSDGRPVSISSHMGGMATGMLIGAAVSWWRLAGRRLGDEDAPGEADEDDDGFSGPHPGSDSAWR